MEVMEFKSHNRLWTLCTKIYLHIRKQIVAESLKSDTRFGGIKENMIAGKNLMSLQWLQSTRNPREQSLIILAVMYGKKSMIIFFVVVLVYMLLRHFAAMQSRATYFFWIKRKMVKINFKHRAIQLRKRQRTYMQRNSLFFS